MASKSLSYIIFLVNLLFLCKSVYNIPINELTTNSVENSTEEENNGTKNYYVVRTIVYEVGILTDTDDENATLPNYDSQERVDLTFFDAHTNDSHINLGNVPLPVQANISGQVLTGIAPVHVGAFNSTEQLLETLPLTASIVNITQSNTALYKISNNTLNAADNKNNQLENLPLPLELGSGELEPLSTIISH